MSLAKLPPMPANVFTNYPLTKIPDSVNVLLLDWLNTQPQDQAYVRAQTIKYLKSLTPGTSLAVFTLGSHLHMVQGFTTDPAVLLAALDSKKVKPGMESTRLLPTTVQAASERDLINLMRMNMAAPAAIEAVTQEMAGTSALHADERVKVTLQALQLLARFLSGIPGRKNVIWFSGSFPISIFPGAGVPREYAGDLRQTADLLTPGRVAIYPVSAEGLTGNFTYEAENAPTPQEQEENLREENVKRAEKQLAMEELAKDTGGQALYNTNGLGDAMAHAINGGAHYYGLAYSPTNQKMDGKYRAIQVKLLRGDYKLAYRRGYYAEKTTTQAGADHSTPGNPLLRRGSYAGTQHSVYYNDGSPLRPCALRLPRRQGLQATFGRLKQWLVNWEHRLNFWPIFKGALAAHEWVIYPFFLLLVVMFFLLLPRACRYP